MFVTAEGTSRFAGRFPNLAANAFFRTVQGLTASSIGIGTYLGRPDDPTDAAYTGALLAAAEYGINVFDTAINYRSQRSEHCIGAALAQLQRDEILVCTKAGFLTRGAVPDSLSPRDVVGGMHSIAPDFLADQIERSRANLRVDAIDVFYLHNPETQIGFVIQQDLEERIARAFTRLEELAGRGTIRWYGMATWEGFRKGALDLAQIAAIAERAGGPGHHFRFIQLPFNVEMVEAYLGRPENVLQTAARLGITVIASASLTQGKALLQMPEKFVQLLPGLETPAQRALQFARSTPGIAVALAGMSRREHVVENAAAGLVPPLSPADYQRFYQ